MSTTLGTFMETLFFPIIAFVIKLITAVVAYGCMRLVLKQLDKALNFNFKQWMANCDDKSKAIYLASRYAATALFFAILLS